MVETTEYIGALRRMIRKAGERAAVADEVELGMLIGLREAVDDAVQVAVNGMRERGCSWAYVASATGVTKQSAQERWGGRRSA
jgi:hypothetical protein